MGKEIEDNKALLEELTAAHDLISKQLEFMKQERSEA